MTGQIKGVRIANLPAITIRNMFRGMGRLLSLEYVTSRCKVSPLGARHIVKTLLVEGYLEFAELSKEPVNPYTPGKGKQRYRQIRLYKLTPKGEKLANASA